MMKKSKDKGIERNKKYLLPITILITLFLYVGVVNGQTTYEGNDNTDDIICVSFLQLLSSSVDSTGAMSGQFSTFNELETYIDSISELGTVSDTPDHLDIVNVKIVMDSPNSRIEITMSSDIESQTNQIQVFSQIECNDGSYLDLYMDYDPVASYEEYGYLDNTTRVQTNGDITNSLIVWYFPSNLIDLTQNCVLKVISFGLDGTVDESNPLSFMNLNACFDSFGIGIEPTSTSTQSTDIIVGFYQFLASFLGICGQLGFLWIIGLFILLGKVFMDRKMLALRITGVIIISFQLYPLFVYSWSLNTTITSVSVSGFNIITFLTITLPSILSLIPSMCLMFFIFLQYLNNFDIVDDNTWLFGMLYSSGFLSTILYMTPFVSQPCSSPVLSIVIHMILILISIIILVLSDNYSERK